MHPSNPLTLILAGLLHPTHLAAYIAEGRRQKVLALLATLQLLGTTFALIAWVIGQLVPIGAAGLLAGGLLAPAFALLLMVFYFLSAGTERSVPANLVFALARCQMAISPPAMLFLALVYSTAFAWLQRSPLAILLLAVLFGMWFAGTITVILMFPPRRAQSAAVRQVLAWGALLAGAAIWLSPPLRQGEAFFFVPLLIGLWLGLLRPLSYLWEGPLSLALALAARLGLPPARLLALHPVAYDELCLLPLPGLGALLARACAVDIEAGGVWLLRVARHPAQGHAALRTVERMVRAGRDAHPVLFWLSTSPEGRALLEQLLEQSPRPQPLVAAYAALAAVADPAAWPGVIARHTSAVAGGAHLPGGQALQALLIAAAGAIQADRWDAAVAALRAAPAAAGVEPDRLWEALATVRSWADGAQPAMVTDRARALALLWDRLDTIDGWPAALLAAMGEHLLFLLTIEYRRGAWLV